jgi:hypothetical protein
MLLTNGLAQSCDAVAIDRTGEFSCSLSPCADDQSVRKLKVPCAIGGSGAAPDENRDLRTGRANALHIVQTGCLTSATSRNDQRIREAPLDCVASGDFQGNRR